jgi:hypothetical protein
LYTLAALLLRQVSGKEMLTGSASKSKAAAGTRIWFCEQKHQLLARFLAAVKELSELHQQQIRAVIEGDPDFTRFETLLYRAGQRKDLAKYALMAHADAHGC